MKRRVVCVLVLAVAVSLLLSFPVFAADGDEGSIWDLLAGIGEFISNGIKAMLDGLKTLFVPSPDYFDRAFGRLQSLFSKKFGGIASLAGYLQNAFKNLSKYKDSANLFTLKFPKSHLFGNTSVNLLSGSSGILSMIRGALTGCVMLFTVAFAYKKVTAMINT